MKRLVVTSLLVALAISFAGCEECETSRDCNPGSVCVDALCETHGYDGFVSPTRTCDAGVLPGLPFGGGYTNQDCGGGSTSG